jgi:hypothetical protein
MKLPSLRALLSTSLLSAALAAPLAAGCNVESNASDEEDLTAKASRVQLNDVSVLFPLAKTQAELDGGYLGADAEGVGGALLPESIYEKATGIQPDHHTGPGPIGSDPTLQYANLKLVAFRIDPCFANVGPITDPSTCKNQLRLVFQALSFDQASGTTALDGAVHAFYSLSREELTGLVDDVIALRKKQGGAKDLGALAVHPLLAKQGLLGGEAKGLEKLILAHAGAQNLTRFTMFVSTNLQTVWTFQGFDIDAKGKSTAMEIPTLPAHTTSVRYFVGFSQGLAGDFTPATKADDDMQILGNLSKAKAASKKDQQAAFDAALRIENPDFHSPNTIDCASCHVAGPGRVITGAALGLSATGNDNAFEPDGKFVKTKDLAQKTKVDMSNGLNVHAFSYKNAQPMIAMRTINETAGVVAYLNTEMKKK